MDTETLSIALCDDEPYFLNTLQAAVCRYLSKQGLIADIRCFSTGEALLQAQQAFSVVLMDIKLPEQSGLTIIEELQNVQPHCQVIFISSSPEYALQAFDLDAVQYCLKPISDEKLARALEKALRLIQSDDCATLTIAKGNQTQRVYLRDIVCCEAIDHRIYIHTQDASYDYFGTLNKLESQLDGRFFRCHKSYLVNVNHVIRKERDRAILAGGHTVLVSRRKQLAFTQRLLTVFRRELL